MGGRTVSWASGKRATGAGAGVATNAAEATSGGVHAARQECGRAVNFVRVIGNVALRASGVGPADACFRGCDDTTRSALIAVPVYIPDGSPAARSLTHSRQLLA